MVLACCATACTHAAPEVRCLWKASSCKFTCASLMCSVMHAAGYAFARGECTSHSNPIIGLSSFFSAGGGASDDDPLYLSLWLFSWVFAAVSVTIPSGALAERCQFRAYLIYTFWQTGLIYPLVVHWVWSHEVRHFQSGKFPPWKGRGMDSTLLELKLLGGQSLHDAACVVPLCHSGNLSLLDNLYFTPLAVRYTWLGLL